MSTQSPNPGDPRRQKCFFCLTTLGQEEARKTENKRNKARFEIIFNYLLQEEPKQNGSLLQSILEELRSPDGSNLVQFCSKCESRITKVSELHKELEVIKKELIDMLKHVRSTIMDASLMDDVAIHFSGSFTEKILDQRLQVSPLESQESEVQQGAVCKDTSATIEYLYFLDETPVTSKLLRLNKILKAFQNAVVMKSPNLPFTSLERCTNLRPVVDLNLHSEEENGGGDTTSKAEDIKKNQPMEVEESDGGEGLRDRSPFSDGSDDDNSSLNEDHIERKRKTNANDEDKYPRQHKKRRDTREVKESRAEKNVIVKKTKNSHGSSKLTIGCEKCPFTAVGPQRRYCMMHHLLKHETAVKTLKCPQCPQHDGISGKQLYNLHLSFHKQKTKCEYCQKDIIDFDLAQHYRTHVDTVYRCQTCPYPTTSLEKYLKHAFLFRTPVKCHICSEFFSVRREFRSHLREEHKVVEESFGDFEGCGKMHVSKKVPQAHQTHTNPSDGGKSRVSVPSSETSGLVEAALDGGSCPTNTEDILKSEPFEPEKFDYSDDAWLPENDNYSSSSESEESLMGKKSSDPSDQEENSDISEGDAHRLVRTQGSATKKTNKTEKTIVTKKTRKSRRQTARKLKVACESCPVTTSGPMRLYRMTHHLLRHEKCDKPLKCPHCPGHEGFSGKQLYNLHLSFHKEECTCSYCQNPVVYFDLAEHYRTHVDTVHQCPTCTYPAISQEDYVMHDSFHFSTLNCQICSEKISNRRSFLVHMHEVHGAIEKMTCDFEGCGRSYLSKRSLAFHQRKAHTTIHFNWESPCVCEICGKGFRTLASLNLHKRIHQRPKLVNNDVTPNKGKRRRRRTRVHPPGPVDCDLCEQKFSRPTDLTIHKMREHADFKFQCEHCGKAYAFASSLKDHVLSLHEGVRYPCTFCDKVFDNRLKLARHRRRHRTPDEVTCKVCGKILGTRASMVRHMKVKHNQEVSR